jgi:molybdopterin-guanine dinucleotide biosynthesis adapter protein
LLLAETPYTQQQPADLAVASVLATVFALHCRLVVAIYTSGSKRSPKNSLSNDAIHSLYKPEKPITPIGAHLPKLIAVVGAKHSGKTTIIEHLIAELKSRGYTVGVIKEMVRIAFLDTPQKETDRYAKAGAQTIAAVPREETVIFIKKRLTIQEILPQFKGFDFVLLEGFESEKEIPKVVAAKTSIEIAQYLDNSAFVVSGVITDSKEELQKVPALPIPLLNSSRDIKKLADIVEQKAA